jgi:hypothetical protein
MPAPTIGGTQRTAPQASQSAKAPVAVIPFTRASRRKSRLASNIGPVTLNASQQALQPMQLPAAGFLRYIDLTVTGTTAGNSANVAFNADGPFNLLQQISLLSANGDSLISPIDGFSLYLLNKYAALGRDRYDPVADPNYAVTTGSGATGGSFTFKLRIPVEVDTRDAFGSLANMAANQSFLLQLSLNNTAGLYTTAPTAAPQITINAVMEYWSAPAQSNATGDVQATTPPGIGSVSLIQTQQPPITASSQQNIQQLNVGNTIRCVIYVLRTSAGVRTEADWPSVTNFYVNNDPWYYKTKANWRSQMGTNYQLTAPTATPTAGAMDNGVFVLNDFINQGSAGNERVSSGGNRNEWLVTGSATAFNIEAVNWGAAANQLLILQNTIRPASPQAVYQPQFN